jgi:hypothetical protein
MPILKSKGVKPKTPKRAVYEPSHFVWLHKFNGAPRQPALVLYEEDEHGIVTVYVTPTEKGDTGRRGVPYAIIEGRIVS